MNIIAKVSQLNLDKKPKDGSSVPGARATDSKAQLAALSHDQRALFEKFANEYPHIKPPVLLNLLKKSEYKENNLRVEVQFFLSMNEENRQLKPQTSPGQNQPHAPYRSEQPHAPPREKMWDAPEDGKAPPPREKDNRRNFTYRQPYNPNYNRNTEYQPAKRKASPTYVQKTDSKPAEGQANPVSEQKVTAGQIEKEIQSIKTTETAPAEIQHEKPQENEKENAPNGVVDLKKNEEGEKPQGQKKIIEANTLPAKGLEKLIKLEANKLKNLFKTMADNFKKEKITVTDSKYKKNIKVKRDWEEEPSVVSKVEKKPRVDVGHKKWESEEEKLKSEREKNLEKTINDLSHMLTEQQSKLAELEKKVLSFGNKQEEGKKKGEETEDIVYCLVPFSSLKAYFNKVDHKQKI